MPFVARSFSPRSTTLNRKPVRRIDGKRLVDLGLIVLFAPLLIPLLALVALAVLWGGGPVTYCETRVGQGGRRFYLWKFRTMHTGADHHLARHLASDPEAAREWALTCKLRNDPRITPLGRILRKTSLDELPQLWNVIRGEMSLVGPRPVPAQELHAQYKNGVGEYLSCTPGMTGLWQVSGRGVVSYQKRIELDREYAVKQSLMLDMSILLRTVSVVVRGTGC